MMTDGMEIKARGGSRVGMTERDLAELFSAFNEVTGRLQSTHEVLREEVERLRGELTLANQQLERSRRLAALGEMAAGISHEVRNPLGAIRLHARMLEQDLPEGSATRTQAEKILAAVRGLDGVVGDVLAFAREVRISAEPVRAGDLLDHALEECLACEKDDERGRECGTPRLEVVRVRDGDDLELACDTSLMHRALVNVIRNAIQAMTPEKHERTRKVGALSSHRRLTVGASRRSTAGSDGYRQDVIVLSVRDTGTGISDEARERMFNPFFTTRAAGTGLGLAIVHRIIDAHRGMVKVRNREIETGGGAEVELMIPAAGSRQDAGVGETGCVGAAA